MNTVWIVMPILIVLMFLLGTDLNRQAFTNVAKKPKGVLVGMIGQLILLPLIAFAIAWALNLPPVYFMGLVLVFDINHFYLPLKIIFYHNLS